MFSYILSFLLLMVPALVNVAFVTLLERKILGLSQLRKGPNKVSYWGVLQPFADALKLFFKETVFPFKSNYSLFKFSPVMMMTLALIFWMSIPLVEAPISLTFSVVLLLVLLGLGVYPLLLSGWASNSKYGTLGGMRSVAQTISYEIALALILFNMMLVFCSLKLSSISNSSGLMGYLAVLLPSMVIFWVLSCVAETNRTPFDFSEGESELVSGFNIEYGASGFTLIFMSEYSMILLFSLMSSFVLTQSKTSIILIFSGLMFVFLWVWARATFPRYRYDKLMDLSWKSVLPHTLVILVALVLFTIFSDKLFKL